MVSYPVPIPESRAYNLEYALIGDRRTACMVFLLPESGNFFSMTRDDYEQYEAAYPDGIKLDPALFPDSLSDSDGDADDEADAASDASSDFIFNPSEESAPFAPAVALKCTTPEDDLSGVDENPSPYKRPSNPEPPTPRRGFSFSCDLSASSGDNNSDATFIPPPMEPEDTQINTDDEVMATMAPISSPYRTRATEASWTGLEITRWGGHSYMTSYGNHMAVLRDWEIESGMSHGLLQHCTWLGYRDRAEVGDPPAGVPELKVTTPEGEDWWLVDVQQYGYEFSYYGGEYGHSCADCLASEDDHHDVEENIEEDGQRVLDAVPEEDDDVENSYPKQFPDTFSELDEDEVEDPRFPKRFLDTIPEEDEDEGSCTIPEEATAEVDEEEDSDFEPVDHEMLNRLATAVLEECDLRKVNAVLEAKEGQAKAAEKKELPMWMRDATYVSGMSWSDMMDEDEEY